MPYVRITTISVAWGAFLYIVLVPRLSWLMADERTCLEFSNRTNSTFEQDWLLTGISAGPTLMLCCLAIAGYSQHGICSSRLIVDFDLAEIAFSLIDGVELLQTFFEIDQEDCDNNVSTHMVTKDLNGSLGNWAIAISMACFILPTFALWLLKRRSNELKASERIDKDKRLLASDVASNAEIENEADALRAKSSTDLNMIAMERNLQTVDTFQKEISVLRAIYVFWDIFCINFPGAVLRIVLWSVHDIPSSVLIARNVLSVLFCTFHVCNDYIRPAVVKRKPCLV